MVDGRARFRTVGYDLDAARREWAAYIDATRQQVASGCDGVIGRPADGSRQ
jgi:hypothetical protein